MFHFFLILATFHCVYILAAVTLAFIFAQYSWADKKYQINIGTRSTHAESQKQYKAQHVGIHFQRCVGTRG